MSERAVIPSRNTFLLFTFFFFGFVLPQSAAAEARPSETYGRLQLHFEANRGQTHDEVRFLARGPGYSLYLTAGEAVLVLAKPNADAKRDAHATRERLGTQTRATPIVVRMSLVGAATKPLVSGLDELPGRRTTSSARIRRSGAPMCPPTPRSATTRSIPGSTSSITATSAGSSMTSWSHPEPTRMG